MPPPSNHHRPAQEPDARLFVCDRMLGRLARRLRLYGFDVLYPDEMPDGDLLALARGSGRILLTRDKLLSGKEGTFYIHSPDIQAQVKEVLEGQKLIITRPLSRCSICNTPVAPAPRLAVESRVPEGVLSRHEEFLECPGCGQVYWKGSHWNRIMEEARPYLERE